MEPELIIYYLNSFPFYDVQEAEDGKLINIPKGIHEYKVTESNQDRHGPRVNKTKQIKPYLAHREDGVWNEAGYDESR